MCEEYSYQPCKAGLLIEPQHWLYSSSCTQNPIHDILAKAHGEGA